MEYRKLPKGNEEISTIGLGLGNIHTETNASITETISYAIEHGINFFDLCLGRTGAYEAFGKAVQGRRDKIYTQMHFGAVYPKGRYEFGRDINEVKASFERVLKLSDLKYTDFGYVHCIDEMDDYENVMRPDGIFAYMCSLKEQGILHHLGFSSHNTSIARRFMETGKVDMFMFSINPVYDYTSTGYGDTGDADDRIAMYREAEKNNIGITVMKPFAGGQLLDQKDSPLNIALTKNQCLQYVLDKPGVVCALPGVSTLEHVKEVLSFYDSSEEERDYSSLGNAMPNDLTGRCVYCNHCSPCPMGIDIGLVNKYYDLAKIGDEMAAGHYRQLNKHADDCIQCGHCESRCPFHVKQMQRMEEIKEYFK